MRVDFENISQRILAVPIPEKNFSNITEGKEGIIYVQERPIVQLNFGPPQLTISRFDFKTRKTDTIAGRRQRVRARGERREDALPPGRTVVHYRLRSAC